jgi:hypothetical protein
MHYSKDMHTTIEELLEAMSSMHSVMRTPGQASEWSAMISDAMSNLQESRGDTAGSCYQVTTSEDVKKNW